MAVELDHVAVANRNHATLLYLLREPLEHPEWIATVAFYKAVHVVEAAFAVKRRCHSNSHDARIDELKHPEFQVLFKAFRPLYAASLVARYLEDSSSRKFDKDGSAAKKFTTFTDFMSAEDVVKRLICKRLYTLEQNAIAFLSEDGRNLLKRISDERGELSRPASV